MAQCSLPRGQENLFGFNFHLYSSTSAFSETKLDESWAEILSVNLPCPLLDQVGLWCTLLWEAGSVALWEVGNTCCLCCFCPLSIPGIPLPCGYLVLLLCTPMKLTCLWALGPVLTPLDIRTDLQRCVTDALNFWPFFSDPENYLALPFFGTGIKTDLFQSCGHCWVFQICWHIECNTFNTIIF